MLSDGKTASERRYINAVAAAREYADEGLLGQARQLAVEAYDLKRELRLPSRRGYEAFERQLLKGSGKRR